MSELETAWNWREELGLFTSGDALRVFYGPGESSQAPLKNYALDHFGDHYWITEWEDPTPTPKDPRGISRGVQLDAQASKAETQIKEFLLSKKAKAAVILRRPEQGLPSEPALFMGEEVSLNDLKDHKNLKERFVCREGLAKYWIQLLGVRHPGLFLDHAPLRAWLLQNSKGWRVLNTFAYTGSLSVAAGLGGAKSVTTLDLSKPSIEWAKQNWALNDLEAAKGNFIFGDVFEWLPRLKRDGAQFDCVISDPPSFSRGNKGSFSTAKDLARLHTLLFDLVSERGWVITSINSEQVSWEQYEAQISQAAREKRLNFEIVKRLDLPETFPTRLGDSKSRYLKGFILRRS